MYVLPIQKSIVMEKIRRNAAKKKILRQEMTAQTYSKLFSFFTDEVKVIYWVEKLLVKTLPAIQKAAANAELQKEFADHLKQSKIHVARLEQVFDFIGEKAMEKKCDAMESLIAEGKFIIEDNTQRTCARDIELIIAAQKAEYYEIATYVSLVRLAHTLGLDEIADLLQTTLAEEDQTNHNLDEITENEMNQMFVQELEPAGRPADL